MKPIYLSAFGFMLLLISGCSSSSLTETELPIITTNETINYDTKILALGDSLTEGYGVDAADSYPAQLQKFLNTQGINTQVINSGISGETSTGLLERLDWVLRQNPDIVILNSGANDAMRGIDLNLTQENLETVVQTILAKDITLIFAGMEIYENLGATYTQEFKNLYPAIAKKYKLPFIPFFLAGVAGNASLNNPDQIHPNADGYKIIVEENIWPIIEPILK